MVALPKAQVGQEAGVGQGLPNFMLISQLEVCQEGGGSRNEVLGGH